MGCVCVCVCPLPLFANFLDIKARAVELRRLVACGDLLGAWIPDNYVPIKFNDCPLFRSTNVRVSLLPPFRVSLPLPLLPLPFPSDTDFTVPSVIQLRDQIGNNYHSARNPITF